MTTIDNDALPPFLRNNNIISKILRRFRPDKINPKDVIENLVAKEMTKIKVEHEKQLKKLNEVIYKLRDEIAIAFLYSGHEPTWTSNIAEYVVAGFGRCSDNGFWDFEVPELIMKQHKESKRIQEETDDHFFCCENKTVVTIYERVAIGSIFHVRMDDKVIAWRKSEKKDPLGVFYNAERLDTKEIMAFGDHVKVYAKAVSCVGCGKIGSDSDGVHCKKCQNIRDMEVADVRG